MKFSLSRLFVIIAFVATLFGWRYDHHRLSADKQRLNTEAASLYLEIVGDGRLTGGWAIPDTEPYPGRIYNWHVEKDRIEYRQNFGFKPENHQIGNDFDPVVES
jgi:hypothetical protein